MENRMITMQQIATFEDYLKREEKSEATREKYLKVVAEFAVWMGDDEVTRNKTAMWKEELIKQGKAPTTINTMVSAINSFFRFAGWDECRTKFLRVQRRLFRDSSKELTQDEYRRLVAAAERIENERLALMLETICATGIRVSEIRYITVQAARAGRAEVTMKGKIRTIIIPNQLCRKLLRYSKKQKTTVGEIFITKSGRGISRRQIWAEMKALCKRANVDESKVFPHNLRHLFARVYHKACKDIVRLADVLGHSSIETTRIYLIGTSDEYAKQIERLGFVT